MDFPDELANPDLIGALVQHSDDDDVIGLRIDACLNDGDPSSWSDFLRSSGLVERETLNHVARSGACQFSAVADQLFRSRPVTENFRPDIYLRMLALHCVSRNQDNFQDFMLHAAPRTRQQRQRGGGGVNMEEYARRMASSRCDGDHITLQALCDALKVNINVVKWTRDNGWYPRSGAAVLGVPLRGAGNGNNKGSDAPAVVREVGGRRPRRSVFVADTLRPRALPSLDDRAGALRLQGRTLWLSLHGEAHFRSLRVREPATEEEVTQMRVRTRLNLQSPLPPSSPVVASAPQSTTTLATRNSDTNGARAAQREHPGQRSAPEATAAVTEVTATVAEEDGPSVGINSSSFAVTSDVRSAPASGLNPDPGSDSGVVETVDVAGFAGTSGSTSAAAVRSSSTRSSRAADDNAEGRGGSGVVLPRTAVAVGAVRQSLGTGIINGDAANGFGLRSGADKNSEGDGKADIDEEEEAEDCSICMCTVTGEPEASSLDTCSHGFHFACIVKWGETTNQCPMCKSRFHVVTRLRDEYVKRFRGSGRRRPMVNNDDASIAFALGVEIGENAEEVEEELEGAHTICLHCGDGGSEEELMLCDGMDCDNGAHTFCCGLEEVPSGEWFCPTCQARRDADARRDAILRRAWAVDSGDDRDSEGEHDSDYEAADGEITDGEGNAAVGTESASNRGARRSRRTVAGRQPPVMARLRLPRNQDDGEAEAVRGVRRRSRRGAAEEGGAGVTSRAMDDDRIEAFERGLVNSSGESNDDGGGGDGASDSDRNGNGNGNDDGDSGFVLSAELDSESEEEEEEVDHGESSSSSSSMSISMSSSDLNSLSRNRRTREHRRRRNNSNSNNDDHDDNDSDYSDQDNVGEFSAPPVRPRRPRYVAGAETAAAADRHDSDEAAPPPAAMLQRAADQAPPRSRSSARGRLGGRRGRGHRGRRRGGIFGLVGRRGGGGGGGGEGGGSDGGASGVRSTNNSSVGAARSRGVNGRQSRGEGTSRRRRAVSTSLVDDGGGDDDGDANAGSGDGSGGGGSRAGGAVGPNLWPRVLASASSAAAPRHAFVLDEIGGEGELEESSEEKDEQVGGMGVVERSWADAQLAVQLAKQGRNKKKKKAPAALKARLAAVKRSDNLRTVARGGGGASSTANTSIASARPSTGTAAAAAPAAASRRVAGGSRSQVSQSSHSETTPPATSRSYKRPRMRTSPGFSSIPASGPRTLVTTSGPVRHGVGSSGGGGGSGRYGSASSPATAGPLLPAASDVRMGQAEVHALVRRLRGVATVERERQRRPCSSSASAGLAMTAGAAAAVAAIPTETMHGRDAVFGSGRRSVYQGVDDAKDVSAEVLTMIEELRRVAVHGDATTLDVLLSSQLLPVLRLWLEPAADGAAFLPPPQRTSLLKVLMALPVQKSHLKDSGLGKLAVAMAADPAETRENRELIKQIIRRWSQLVLSTPRELPVSPFSPNNHVSPKTGDRRGGGGVASNTARFWTSSRAAAALPSSSTMSAATPASRAAAGGWAAAIRSHRAAHTLGRGGGGRGGGGRGEDAISSSRSILSNSALNDPTSTAMAGLNGRGGGATMEVTVRRQARRLECNGRGGSIVSVASADAGGTATSAVGASRARGADRLAPGTGMNGRGLLYPGVPSPLPRRDADGGLSGIAAPRVSSSTATNSGSRISSSNRNAPSSPPRSSSSLTPRIISSPPQPATIVITSSTADGDNISISGKRPRQEASHASLSAPAPSSIGGATSNTASSRGTGPALGPSGNVTETARKRQNPALTSSASLSQLSRESSVELEGGCDNEGSHSRGEDGGGV